MPSNIKFGGTELTGDWLQRPIGIARTEFASVRIDLLVTSPDRAFVDPSSREVHWRRGGCTRSIGKTSMPFWPVSVPNSRSASPPHLPEVSGTERLPSQSDHRPDGGLRGTSPDSKSSGGPGHVHRSSLRDRSDPSHSSPGRQRAKFTSSASPA